MELSDLHLVALWQSCHSILFVAMSWAGLSAKKFAFLLRVSIIELIESTQLEETCSLNSNATTRTSTAFALEC